MRRIVRKTIKIVAGIAVVVLPLFFWIDNGLKKMNARDMAVWHLQCAGTDFFRKLKESGAFSMAETERQLAFLQEIWRELQSETGYESDIYSQNFYKSRNKYCDASIWTVIKNMPENPPDNLVVLATRNIDPSSLRVRPSGEMYKHIRFDERFEPPENMPILRKYAALITANGCGAIISVVPPTSKKVKATTYNCDYTQTTAYYGKEAFFDLTTNLVNGVQVKYLTPDGAEVIPTNDLRALSGSYLDIRHFSFLCCRDVRRRPCR